MDKRIIKFRGKRVDNGQWIEGSLVNNIWFNTKTKAPVCYIFPSDMLNAIGGDSWEDFADVAEEFEVIPSTVGQYTGLKDKDGRKIYEGDKLLIKGDATAVVVWRNEGFDILDTCSCTPTNKGVVEGFVYSPDQLMEVIGNIHDNPDLIKPKE